MTDVQLENGYTMIANELLDALCKYDFPPKTNIPEKIILFVLRKTYGYHKKTDVISLSQFQKGIKQKNRTNLVYWLNYLVQARILVRERLEQENQVKYGLNKNYDEWLPLVQVNALVQVRTWGSARTDTKSSARTDTNKRKKYNYKRNSAASPPREKTFNSLGAEIIKAFEEVDPKNKTYYGNKTQRGACDYLLSQYSLEEIVKRIQFLPKSNKLPFFPRINSPNDLKEKWVKLEDAVTAKRSELENKNKIAFV